MDSSSDEETENSRRNSYSTKETYISKQRGTSTRRAAEVEFRSLSRPDSKITKQNQEVSSPKPCVTYRGGLNYYPKQDTFASGYCNKKNNVEVSAVAVSTLLGRSKRFIV